MRKIKVIGIGGIGANLLAPLCFYLARLRSGCEVTLIDGDRVEEKNLDRQPFKNFGNKASVKAGELAREFKRLSLRAWPEFVDAHNIMRFLTTGDTIFLCVDNHSTRKLVSDFCETLPEVTLISGGNEKTDGNVQVFIRRGGRDITNSLAAFHPEIENPPDVPPSGRSCSNLLARPGGEQLFITNLAVACEMLKNFWRVENELYDQIGETYVDLMSGNTKTIVRRVENASRKNDKKQSRKKKGEGRG